MYNNVVELKLPNIEGFLFYFDFFLIIELYDLMYFISETTNL